MQKTIEEIHIDSIPTPECLMVKELVPGALQTIRGVVEYSDYEALR